MPFDNEEFEKEFEKELIPSQPLYGKMALYLDEKYRKIGFSLTQDEHFIYLSRTGIAVPWVYSAHGTSMERIYKEIDDIISKGK